MSAILWRRRFSNSFYHIWTWPLSLSSKEIQLNKCFSSWPQRVKYKIYRNRPTGEVVRKCEFMWPWNIGQRSATNPDIAIFPCSWLIKYLYDMMYPQQHHVINKKNYPKILLSNGFYYLVIPWTICYTHKTWKALILDCQSNHLVLYMNKLWMNHNLFSKKIIWDLKLDISLNLVCDLKTRQLIIYCLTETYPRQCF